MKFFLDCGAHEGGSVRHFRSTYPDWRDYELHCFEPNPAFWEGLRALNVNVHTQAVWIEDGECSFYLHRGRKMKASSLLSNKPDLDIEFPIAVMCIDFGAWIKRSCAPGDHIVLKMDIEGAEYRVLNQMIADGSINYVNELYVDWHGHKVGVPQDMHQKLVDDLTSCGLEPKVWRSPKTKSAN